MQISVKVAMLFAVTTIVSTSLSSGEKGVEKMRFGVIKKAVNICFVRSDQCINARGGFKIRLNLLSPQLENKNADRVIKTLKGLKWNGGDNDTETFIYSFGIHVLLAKDNTPVGFVDTSGAPKITLMTGRIEGDFFVYDEKSKDLGFSESSDYYVSLGKRFEKFIEGLENPIVTAKYREMKERRRGSP